MIYPKKFDLLLYYNLFNKFYIKRMESDNVFDIIKSLFEKYGNNDYIGEPITQSEHFLQCATLAEKNNEPDEIIIGALLHDIGHLLIFDKEINSLNKEIKTMGNLGVYGHENIGADFLNSLKFSDIIVKLVRNHVNAKRYLLNKNKNYLSKLSSASQKTLLYQGGIMSDEEADEFEKDEDYQKYIKIRLLDDNGKEIGKEFNNLDHFKNKILKFIKK